MRMKKQYLLGLVALTALAAGATAWQAGNQGQSENSAGSVVVPLAAPAGTTSANTQAGGVTPLLATDYQAVAKTFLTKVHNAFIKTTSTPNSSVMMYANVLNYQPGPDNYVKGSDVAYLWTEDNMVRALYWGARLDSATYKPLLLSAVDQLDWYWNPNCAGSAPGATPGGYGVRHGQPCYYDDNALLGGNMLNVYLDVSLTQSVSDNAFKALGYVDNNQNSHNGVSQKPGDPDWSTAFYMSPVTRVGAAYSRWAARFPNKPAAPGRLTWGTDMFNQVNLASMDLLAPSGLFRGGATCNTAGQPFVCDSGNSGVLAGNSTGVAALALAIHKNNPSETAKLAYAQSMMNTVLAHSAWFPSSGGIKQNAPTGGYATIDLLCQLYLLDNDVTWYNSAKSLVDFLIASNKDRYGWYANGVPGDGDTGETDGDPSGLAGTWAEDRTGNTRPADTQARLITQAAAAAALLQFAYIDKIKNGG
ncbi:hypothetical protein HZY97_11900 [Sphingomonas sp. R-74633]|uniref:hypothetical protein n=1 Tax=Sphingomonas sp. R-74633 TaxID=2751188 RepID=UPI0015D2D9FA|nr:hypothetical protein [Sphingomonas sp. R-74633]NYT41464.1 hypothetical protein [Sphingomonas sp. R-74633]